ncbi:cytochrome c [Budvicia aquatica]|uniref:Alcohol dehydrogenase n=1 Tax=Budvicia aquatica TaxID=82979 RepID=A0A2C6DI00_9GAMM|nr:cytochrome c [Budvicia aquatica]PHI28065.1 alcohol dehydrogenase [Budvicia aquatica]VFS45835.1 Gluconate 2-dehydrogenase cytochrome c subunit precursor [Budvicia aquatica]
MKKFLLAAGLSMGLAAPAFAAETVNYQDENLIKQGEYLARAGDCVACHTASGGQPFAGGLPIESPIGTIFSTNITPDKSTGIGDYSFTDFDNAVRHGIGKDSTLYPAMPYPSYARVTDADMQALYAYFMHGVKPVNQANKPTDIVWPLSMRWPLSFWRWTFAPEVKEFKAPVDQDPVVARGAYLVEGLGHCGACHSPRGIGMQEKALTAEDGELYLSGGEPMDGWVPKNLRGDLKDGLGSWTEAQLVQFLTTGRTEHTAVFGGMSDVIVQSMQYMTDDDLTAIVRYLKTLPGTTYNETPFKYDDAAYNALYNGDDSAVGASVYVDNCAACHRTDGKGYAEVFPAFTGNPVLLGNDATSLIHIVLKGDTLPSTFKAPTSYNMPAFDTRLTDKQVADVVNFIRNSWGNQASPVTEKQVADVRSDVKAAAYGAVSKAE